MTFVADGKERLDRFLARRMPEHSRTRLARLIEEGGVLVEGEAVDKPRFELRPGMSVEVGDVPETAPHDLTPVAMSLTVVFEDEHLLVVDKPRGLAVHPASSLREPTLVHGLLARSHPLSQAGGEYRPGIVHRLDKETTGLMMVAKTDAAHRALQSQIQAKSAERRYVAFVRGTLPASPAKIDAPIGRHPGMPSLMTVKESGRPAVTHVKTLRTYPSGSLVACRLETGRTHQIRVHLAWAGCPVLGDRLYAPTDWREAPLRLHSAWLAFDHPTTGERLAFLAAPPDDFPEAAGADLTPVEVW